MFKPKTVVLAAGLALWSPASPAARPMITDDARIVDAKACQLESWGRRNAGSTELWALPACNFTGGLELSLGGARTRIGDRTQTSDLQFQGKTVFRKLETNGWGYGLAGGVVRHPDQRSGRRIDEAYAYVPMTLSLKEDRAFAHLNLGLNRDRERRETRLTWGLGGEHVITPRGTLIAEAFGRDRGKPFLQLGYRHWLVPERVQVDITYGNQFGLPREERWFTLGLRLLSVPFLP